jgi:S1-C subfamily serine protease
MGLSFAIPIDVAMDVQNQLAHGGKVQRGRLGVSVQTLDQDLARSFGMETPQGALVNQVQDNMQFVRSDVFDFLKQADNTFDKGLINYTEWISVMVQ